MSRAAYIGCVLWGWAGFASSGLAAEPLHLKPGPHLFVDDYLIASQHGLKRVAKEPDRLPHPIVTGPEDKCFQPYVTVVRDPETSGFGSGTACLRMKAEPPGVHGTDDGIRWQRRTN
jgi:hypothetical protein